MKTGIWFLVVETNLFHLGNSLDLMIFKCQKFKMPRESSHITRLRLLGGGVLLLAAGVVFLHDWDSRDKAQQRSLQEISANRRLSDTKTERSEDPNRKTRNRAPRRDPKEWLAEILTCNPGLEPEWRNIPDHENGFLQWLEFNEKHRVNGEIGSETLDLPDDILRIISDPAKWDPSAIESFLIENEDFLETITRIGLLPSQSAAGIDVDRWSFVGARFTKQCSELLLADARLAAESGDPGRALRRVRAASGLANHYDQVEAPSLLMETISILVRLQVQDSVMNQLLPNLDPTPGEIAQWREAIRPPDMEPSAFSKILRGEGWVSLGGIVIPVLNGDLPESSQIDDIPDRDALLDFYAQGYIAGAKRAQAFTLDELVSGDRNQMGFPLTADRLSEEAQKLLEITATGASAWAKGWTRGMVLSARVDAALAIMAGEEPPLEPFTGLPYIYDPEARTLQVPDDPRLTGESMKIGEPIQLP